jgi:hypothetical protein
MMAIYVPQKKDSFTRKLDTIVIKELGVSILIKNQKVLIV